MRDISTVARFLCRRCDVTETPGIPDGNRSLHALAGTTAERALAFARGQGTPIWLVGGAVRDWLIGRANHDLDLIVPEGGIRLARAVATAFGGGFFVLDRERDVGRAVLRDENGQALYVDVARLRAPSLPDDLAYRDFTVNAIAVDLQDGDLSLIDPTGGRADLERRLLRVVSDASFRDDPLRMLRAVRLVAEMGFRLEEATAGLIRRDGALLATVAVERVRDELVRIVTAPGAWRHLRLLAALGLLSYTLPEAAALVGVTQSAPHYLDVFDHTRSVMAHAEGILALLWPAGPYGLPQTVSGDPVLICAPEDWAGLAGLLSPYADILRSQLMEPLASGHTRRDWYLWAALAHDWGKVATRSSGPDARVHFYEHDRQGGSLAESRARALAFAAGEVSYLRRMVAEHMRYAFMVRDYPPGRRALYHYFRATGAFSLDCLLLGLADKMSTRVTPVPRADQSEWWQRQLDVAGLILRSHEQGGAPSERGTLVNPHPTPFLDGREIMARFGLPPGPYVGRLLEGLREAQGVGEVTTVAEAEAWLSGQIEQDR